MFRRLDWVENSRGEAEWEGSERRASQPAHGCGEAIVAKRERGQRGSRIHGEWEVRVIGRGAFWSPMEEIRKQWR